MKEGWEYKKLDEICTIVGRIGFRGYTKADLVKSSNDGAITLSPSNIIDGELDFSNCTYINWDKYYESPEIMLEKGDIVLVKTASIGKCAVVKELPHEATLNPQFVVLKQLVGVPDFICYYLKSPIAQNTIKQMAGGVAIPTLTQKKLGMMIVPTPSQCDQQTIVKYLDSAFAKIEAMKANAEKALNEAKALFQASLKEMLEPKEGWEEKTLKEVCSLITDGTHHSPLNDERGKYKYITAKNIKIWGLDLSNITYVSEDIHKEIIARCNPQKGDVLYIKDGATTGIAIVNPLEEEFSMLSSVALIKPNKDVLSSEFLCYTLNSPSIYSQTRNQMDGAAITRVTLVKIKGFVVSIPPISEQQRIVDYLDSLKSKVDRLQENFDKISKECDALKQAILRQVFE